MKKEKVQIVRHCEPRRIAFVRWWGEAISGKRRSTCKNEIASSFLFAMTLVRKLSLFFIFSLLFVQVSLAQSEIPHYPDSLFSTYYHQKTTQFRLLPIEKGETIFLGNGITDGGSWSEIFQDPHIINRRISGDVTIGVLNRLANIIKRQPEKIFYTW